jgi:hypothetical protein
MRLVGRYLTPQVRRDLRRKMVFVAGPRQVGKSTLARQVLGRRPGYLNWDIGPDRERILRGELPVSSLWVFDEIHKFRRWRNYLKGIYDARRDRQQILVTGSARLDYYRFGGDSLQGRYHLLRMHPLSVAELGIDRARDFDALLRLGGFPEPFLSGSDVEARRWSREYRTLLVREELASVERVLDLTHVEQLVMRLPDLVGAPLSLNALREDLQVSHKTVSHWMAMLERLYAVFRVAPFGHPKIRAVKKEQKHYHLDWTVVARDPARFENVVAVHLLKWVHFQQDTRGRDVELRYFRDVDGREVDFVVTEGVHPRQLIECTWDDVPIDRGLRYLHVRFPRAEAFQISAVGRKDYVTADGIRVCPALTYLRTLV